MIIPSRGETKTKYIGVDLGGRKIRYGCVVDNRLEKVATRIIDAKGSKDKVLSQVTGSIDDVFDDDVAGIGIGVPTIVDENGIIYETANIPSWKRVPLKQILRDRYKVPAHVDNDANCFALGEKYFGKGRPYQNFVGVTLGTGFGVGIIIDGKLYSGNAGGAGEFGGIPFRDRNLDYYCGWHFFLDEYGFTEKELSQRVKQGDKAAQEAFKRFGDNLGHALAIIVNALAPEAIILGGGVAKTYELFETSMRNSLRSSVFRKVYERLMIEKSDNEDIQVLGAAALCYE